MPRAARKTRRSPFCVKRGMAQYHSVETCSRFALTCSGISEGERERGREERGRGRERIPNEDSRTEMRIDDCSPVGSSGGY